MAYLTNISGTQLTTIGGSLLNTIGGGDIITNETYTPQQRLLVANTSTFPKKYRFTLSNPVFGTKILKYAPDGWKDDEYAMIRDMKRFGVFRKFSQAELKFIKDGRDYVQAVYEGYGVNADVTMLVEIFSTSNEYVTRFTGKIDFSTYKINELFCSVQVKDASFTDLILSRETIDVDIYDQTSIDGTDIGQISEQPVKIPQLSLRAYADWENGGITETDSHVLPITLTWFNFAEAATQGSTLGDPDSGFFKNSLDDYTTVGLSFVCGIIREPNKIYDFDVVIDRYNGGILTETIYDNNFYSESGSSGGRYVFQDVVTFDIATGDYLLLWIRDNTTVHPPFNYEYTSLKISQENVFIPDSFAWGILYYECFNRLVAHYTGITGRVKSDYFANTNSGSGVNGVVMTATMLTGRFDQNEMIMNLQKLFNSLSLFNIGIGVETISGVEKLVIEDMAHFFSNRVILDVSSRIDESLIEKSVIPELYANQLQFGFDSYDYNRIGGVYDPNTKASYSTPIKSIKAYFSIVSPFRADSTGLITILDEFNTDPQYQPGSDIYILDTFYNGSLLEAVVDHGYDYVHGDTLLGTILFNVLYTPARTLRRWGRFISAMLHNSTVKLLKHVTPENQTNLTSKLTAEAEPVIEKSDVTGEELETNLWINEAYSVELPLEETDIDKINANPYGIIKLSPTKYGWILDYKSKNENGKQSFRLLRVNLAAVTPDEARYGLLYNAYAVNESVFGITGWHVPSPAEWATLQAATDASVMQFKQIGVRLHGGSFVEWTAVPGCGRECVMWDNYSNGTDNGAIEASEFCWDSYASYKYNSGLSVRLIKDDSTEVDTVTDIDGNEYPCIKIGSQVWMLENFRCKHYTNGGEIANVPDASNWTSVFTGAWCYYDNDSNNG